MSRDQAKDKRERFIELLSPTSKNFTGTGLTIQEFMQLGAAERVTASWFRQERKERQRRLGFVSELCLELAKIKAVTLFSTGLAESGIEALIEGDWATVKDYAELLMFEDDPPTRERHAALYARFSELLHQAYETRPDETRTKA